MEKLASYEASSSESEDEKTQKSGTKQSESKDGPGALSDLIAEWESYEAILDSGIDGVQKSSVKTGIPAPVPVPAPTAVPPPPPPGKNKVPEVKSTANDSDSSDESSEQDSDSDSEPDSEPNKKSTKCKSKSESASSDDDSHKKNIQQKKLVSESGSESDDEPPKKKNKSKKADESSSSEDSSEEESGSDEESSEESSSSEEEKKKPVEKPPKPEIAKRKSKSPPAKQASRPKKSRSRSRSGSRSRGTTSKQRHTSSSHHDRRRRDRSADRKHYRRHTRKSHRSRSRDRHRRRRSRSRGKRSRSRDRRRRHRSRSRSHERRKRGVRRSRSRSRDRRRRGPPTIITTKTKSHHNSNKPLTYKETLRQKLLQAQKDVAEGKLVLDPSTNLMTNNEVPSPLPLMSLTPSGTLAQQAALSEKVTPQQALIHTMAAMHQKAQEITGVAVPKYYNPAAVNPLKYAEQIKKRKLLWSHADKKEEANKPVPEKVVSTTTPQQPHPALAASGSRDQWKPATAFIADEDGKMEAKFKKLMGIKQDPAAAPKSKEEIQKQLELFQQLDRDYEFARITTHTQRGVGLGFGSQSYPDAK